MIAVDPHIIALNVQAALHEDIGSGDITAQLIAQDALLSAQVITRETAIIAGRHWVDATFQAIDPQIAVNWLVHDGDSAEPNQTLFTVQGPARSVLTAERTALNFLQLLSGVATTTHQYVSRIAHTSCCLLDTRKTIPGLRIAQKYAVTCGGGHNHRIGLYDAFLIKENHIAACGGIGAAIAQAKQNHPGKPIEIEVETLDQLNLAQQAGADIIMLDNFTLDMMQHAVGRRLNNVKLEASGNVSLETIASIAETGVDYISVGALTKHVQAIDLSMRFMEQA